MAKSKIRKRHQRKITEERKPQEKNQNVEKSGCLLTVINAFIAVICLAIAFLAFAYARSPISAVVVVSHDTDDMIWNKEYNNNLQTGQRLFTDLQGPESIAVDENNNLYTGLHDGRLIKISDIGKPTEQVHDITNDVDYTAGGDRTLKRPLGMRIFRNKLYFADSYQGIFSVDLETLAWEKIVGYNEVSPPLNHANDLTISKDGDIYFTDACGRWTYEYVSRTLAEGRCTGRVFKIEKNTKRVQLLKDNLCMANGIELTRDETKLLVSEVSLRRIVVIDIRNKEIIKTILLPSGGDNIRRSPTGGYWVPLPSSTDPIIKFVDRYPFIRDIGIQIFGNDLMKFARLDQGRILKLNEELDIEQIHQDLEGKVARAVTEVQEYQPGKFLLGSFIVPGIVKLDNIPSFNI